VNTPAGGDEPRLLLLTPDFPPSIGGIQTHMHRLASGVEGFRTRVLTPAAAGASAFDATSGVDTARVRTPGPPPLAHALLDAAALREAVRFRPDVVLSGHIVVSPAAALIRRSLRAKVVQFCYAKEIGARPRLAAYAARHADAVIGISSYCAELLRAAGAPTDRLALVPPGVDIPAVTEPLPSERPTVLTIGRLQDSYKGHDTMVEALGSVRERVPDVEWVVIGEGPLRAGLQERARSRGLAGSVRFLGSVSDEERNRWLRRADVFAMPGRLPDGRIAGEGFGIVYLEAGAYGKPVVAGNVAGALDAVADGETGLLVDPTDASAVAGAIARLLLDPALARSLGAAGAQRAARYAWPLIARRVADVLAGVLPAGAAGRGTAAPSGSHHISAPHTAARQTSARG
jgi:phosphatidylinositol alpha-1,6-mannosyltransferase